MAGLSAAWHLQHRGRECYVFEKEPVTGGLCRSKRIKGFIFDCDGHLLHFRNAYTLRLVRKLLKGNLVSHKRSAWIRGFDTFIRYPFQANLYALPRPVAQECLTGFLEAVQARDGRPIADFREWIHSNFGRGIARHFMFPYNEKFWTIPLDKIVPDWTGNFVPMPKPSEVIKGFFSRGNDHFGYNVNFWYPRRAGIGQLPLAFERQLKNISKNCRVTGIDIRKKEMTVEGKGRIRFGSLISTMPLPELAKIIRPLPAGIKSVFGKLRWNSIFNLNLGVEGVCHKGRHWVYFPYKDTVFFRTGFFHNFSSDIVPSGKSAIYAEVAYSSEAPIDKNKIVGRITNDLYACGVLNRDNRIEVLDINDIKYGYPIYDKNYLRITRAIREFLSRHNIISCGRYGSWKYMSMEDAILDGKQAADRMGR